MMCFDAKNEEEQWSKSCSNLARIRKTMSKRREIQDSFFTTTEINLH